MARLIARGQQVFELIRRLIEGGVHPAQVVIDGENVLVPFGTRLLDSSTFIASTPYTVVYLHGNGLYEEDKGVFAKSIKVHGFAEAGAAMIWVDLGKPFLLGITAFAAGLIGAWPVLVASIGTTLVQVMGVWVNKKESFALVLAHGSTVLSGIVALYQICPPVARFFVRMLGAVLPSAIVRGFDDTDVAKFCGGLLGRLAKPGAVVASGSAGAIVARDLLRTMAKAVALTIAAAAAGIPRQATRGFKELTGQFVARLQREGIQVDPELAAALLGASCLANADVQRKLNELGESSRQLSRELTGIAVAFEGVGL